MKFKSKKELPWISFCMPNYNDGDTIGEAIESIFDQDYPNVEMIVCDDGSTDDSKKVLAKKEKKFKNLKVIYSRHKGACFARNLAAKEAKGKYLSFLPADAVLYPGVARNWVEHLESNPDYEFLYGGYRFVEEETRKRAFDYLAEPFDEYFLKIANYIDGSYPLTKDLFDRMGGWDTSIKSLQDWDFWLNAVINHGAKGFYIPDVFFETTLPHKGGLSDDSHKNWLERTRVIKKKYGIEDSPICVTSKGAPFHGKKIAKMLEADYKDAPQHKQHDYDMIYSIGFYPSLADQCAQSFEGHRGLRVAHWIGSDVWQLQQMSTQHKMMFVDWIKNNIDVNLSEFKTTQKELAAEGIKSKIVPIPPTDFFDVSPLPKKFTVAIYSPGQNRDFYFPQLIDEVAKKARDVEFKVFGNMEEAGKKGNVEYLGHLNKTQMAELIKNSSALLRLVVHDGLSINAEEFMCAGRRFITNIDNIKHSFKVDLDIENIIDTLNKVKKCKEPDTTAATYWRKKLSHGKYKKFFNDLLKYDPKDYWEKRANSWEAALGDNNYEPKDVETVVKKLKEMKPKSIIDVGCGNGNWAKIFEKELGVDYLGVDISSKMIKHAKKRCPKLNFKTLDIRDLGKFSQKFDVAFMYTCMLHVPEEDMQKVADNLRKIAKRVVFVEPTKVGQASGYRHISETDQKEIEGGNLIYHPRAVHIHDYDKYFEIKKRKSLGAREMMII